MQEGKTGAISNAGRAILADLPTGKGYVPAGPISFKIGTNSDGGKIAVADSSAKGEYLTGFLNDPNICALIDGAGLELGELVSWQDANEYFELAELRRSQARGIHRAKCLTKV